MEWCFLSVAVLWNEWSFLLAFIGFEYSYQKIWNEKWGLELFIFWSNFCFLGTVLVRFSWCNFNALCRQPTMVTDSFTKSLKNFLFFLVLVDKIDLVLSLTSSIHAPFSLSPALLTMLQAQSNKFIKLIIKPVAISFDFSNTIIISSRLQQADHSR